MRTIRLLTLSLAVALSAASWSCQQEQTSPTPSETFSVEEHSIERNQASYAALYRYEGENDDLEVVDVSTTGQVLLGRPLPVPPNGTFRLVFEPALVERDGRAAVASLPERVQDARFSPDGLALLLLDQDDALLVLDLPSGALSPIDEKVFPGFAFSSDGRLIAYAKGEAPMLDAYVYDREAGTARQLTSSQLPVWGFAFSPDDATLAFVYSPLGFPSIYTVAVQGGEPRAWTNVGLSLRDVRAGASLAPFPNGRKPPQWVHGVLVFESHQGVFGVGPEGAVVWERPGANRMFRAGADTVHYHLDGAEYAARIQVSP